MTEWRMQPQLSLPLPLLLAVLRRCGVADVLCVNFVSRRPSSAVAAVARRVQIGGHATLVLARGPQTRIGAARRCRHLCSHCSQSSRDGDAAGRSRSHRRRRHRCVRWQQDPRLRSVHSAAQLQVESSLPRRRHAAVVVRDVRVATDAQVAESDTAQSRGQMRPGRGHCTRMIRLLPLSCRLTPFHLSSNAQSQWE